MAYAQDPLQDIVVQPVGTFDVIELARPPPKQRDAYEPGRKKYRYATKLTFVCTDNVRTYVCMRMLGQLSKTDRPVRLFEFNAQRIKRDRVVTFIPSSSHFQGDRSDGREKTIRLWEAGHLPVEVKVLSFVAGRLFGYISTTRRE